MIKQTIFLVINSQLFLLYNFSKFLHIFTLFIHPSTLNITNITPHSPDDGSAEPKRYSVDWLCFSINPHFLFGLLVVNFSSQIVGLLSIIFFHIYIYIYIYIYECIYMHTCRYIYYTVGWAVEYIHYISASVLVMTLNHLIPKLSPGTSEESRIPLHCYYSRVHFGTEQ